MKRVLVIIAACLTLTANLYSQCTPGSSTGTPGVTPLPDNVTCIQQGVPYDITMQLENFNVIQSLVKINWARIDSLVNFPCGITWQANQLQFAGGETGCVRVSGTTTDPVGQYPLGIYMTVNLSDNLGLGQTTEQSGEISSLISQLENALSISLGIDLSYYSRVVAPGGNCPAIDRGINANNLNSSGATCQPVGVSAPTKDFTFDISPNPSNGVLSLDFSAENSEDTYALTVMDLAGKKVFEENYTSINGTVQKQLDLSNLPKGTYALQLSSGEGMGVKKLVIR